MSEFDQAGERDMDARLRRQGQALRAERSGCPHPELLFARRSEALEADVRDRLAAHVSTCAACRQLAEDVDGLGPAEPDADIEQRVIARVSGPTRQHRAGLLPLAAGLVLAAGLAATWWYSGSTAPAGVTPTASQAPAVAPIRAPVVALWAVTPAPVRVPLSSLGVPRSGDADSNPDGAVLVEALAPYESGDFVGAAARLATVVRDFPESGEAHFYLGVSQLLAGHPAQAVASLDLAIPRLPVTRRAEAEWYRASAEQRAGMTDRARAHLRSLCAQRGAFQTPSCAAEASLK